MSRYYTTDSGAEQVLVLNPHVATSAGSTTVDQSLSGVPHWATLAGGVAMSKMAGPSTVCVSNARDMTSCVTDNCGLQWDEGVVSCGPWGGHGGAQFHDGRGDISDIFVTHTADHVMSIQSCYKQGSGVGFKTSADGTSTRGHTSMIKLQWPEEYLVQVKGTTDNYSCIGEVVTSLTFITNKRVYGPYGRETGQRFESIPCGKVVGFFGKCDNVLHQFGVLTQRSLNQLHPEHRVLVNNLCDSLKTSVIDCEQTCRLSSCTGGCGNEQCRNRFITGCGIKSCTGGCGNEHCRIRYRTGCGISSCTGGCGNEQCRIRFTGCGISSCTGGCGNERCGLRFTSYDSVLAEGPWGGASGGRAFHDGHGRVVGISVTYQANKISSFQATYEHGGVHFLGSLHGIESGTLTKIRFNTSEYLVQVKGTIGCDAVTSLIFVTNQRTFGPYGCFTGTTFESSPGECREVTGFFGRSGTHLDQIGVITKVLARNVENCTSTGVAVQGPWGGQYGSQFCTGTGELEEIYVTFNNSHIVALQVTYNLGSRIHSIKSDCWGGVNGQIVKFNLRSNGEYLIQLKGTMDVLNNGTQVVSSLTFITNKKVYGPYGSMCGSAFESALGKVVGFFGRSDSLLRQVGVITEPGITDGCGSGCSGSSCGCGVVKYGAAGGCGSGCIGDGCGCAVKHGTGVKYSTGGCGSGCIGDGCGCAVKHGTGVKYSTGGCGSGCIGDGCGCAVKHGTGVKYSTGGSGSGCIGDGCGCAVKHGTGVKYSTGGSGSGCIGDGCGCAVKSIPSINRIDSLRVNRSGTFHNTDSRLFDYSIGGRKVKGSFLGDGGTGVHGPWGGVGGDVFCDGRGEVVEILLSFNAQQAVSMQVSYLHGSTTFKASAHGGCGDHTAKICLRRPTEQLMQVKGTTRCLPSGDAIITSLTFITNENICGPFGCVAGDSFESPSGRKVTGFFGRSSSMFLNQLGVFTDHHVMDKYNYKLGSAENRRVEGAWGGLGGASFYDGGGDIIEMAVAFNETQIVSLQTTYDHNGLGYTTGLSTHLKHDHHMTKVGNCGCGGGNCGTCCGGNGSTIATIKLDIPDEHLIQVQGTIGQVHEENVVTSLTFVTNKRCFGPYGSVCRRKFQSSSSGSIVGFYGRSSLTSLNQLGCIKYTPSCIGMDTTCVENIVNSSALAIHQGPWGGCGGDSFSETQGEISNINISFNDTFITSIQVAYKQGRIGFQGRLHGGSGVRQVKIHLDSDEILLQVQGTSATVNGSHGITSLTFTTNKCVYGPYGTVHGRRFQSSTTTKVVGFFGQASNILNQLGVITMGNYITHSVDCKNYRRGDYICCDDASSFDRRHFTCCDASSSLDRRCDYSSSEDTIWVADEEVVDTCRMMDTNGDIYIPSGSTFHH